MAVSFTPVELAIYVRQRLPARERGALLVECSAGGELMVAAFGNDRYRLDKRVNREVELVRQWLTAAGAREVGFGVSPDGHSWAMVLRVEERRYHTPAGRAFHAEMVRAEVEEEVQRAWVEACGTQRLSTPEPRRNATREKA
jgi:hypothetical protein